MSKQHADSTPDEKAPKRRKLSADEVLVEAARNGDTTAVRAGLEKLSPDTDSKKIAFDAVHEACRGNHDECLALLLPYVETTQMGFGMLLSECIHADHTACTEVLLQHWKSVCSNVAFVPYGQEEGEDRPCPAMWADPAVCQVLIDAGSDIETKDDMGRSPLHWSCHSGELAVVKMLVEAGAGVCVTDDRGNTCLTIAADGHTETVRYLVGLKDVNVNHKADDDWSALFNAVLRNHADVVEVLIDAGADIETTDEQGCSPLHWACRSGALAVVIILVAAGAGACVTCNFGDTCLMFAARYGHTETVRFLVGLSQAHGSHKSDDGYSAVLEVAVELNHADVMQVLIDAGADIEVKGNDGRSPLLVASQCGNPQVVKVLVKAGADVCVTDSQGHTCLTTAASLGHTETMRTLLCMPEVDVNRSNISGDTALHHAVLPKHSAVSKLLIDAGADIDAKAGKGRTPLHWACEVGELDIVEMLVEAGADVCVVDDDGYTCLIVAASFGHAETVRYLVGLREVDVNHSNTEGFTPLHLAVSQKYSAVSKLLIDAGADIEAQTSRRSTPLHWACEGGELDIVEMLVEAGADVSVVDDDGYTCLILAVDVGHTETVRTLLCMTEVDVNQSNAEGNTPLHFAVSQKDFAVSKVLIDAGADVEAKDSEGSTPLHCACEVGELEIVKMLVKAGADVSVVDDAGSTCLILAASFGHAETVRYLVGLREVDVNHRDLLGHTALHHARQEQHADVEQVLLKHGAEAAFSHTCSRAECWACCRLFLQGGVPGAWVPRIHSTSRFYYYFLIGITYFLSPSSLDV